MCVNNGKTNLKSKSSCARAQHYSLLNETKIQKLQFRTIVTQPLIPTHHFSSTNSHFHFSYKNNGFLQNYFSYCQNTSHTKKLQKEKHSEVTLQNNLHQLTPQSQSASVHTPYCPSSAGSRLSPIGSSLVHSRQSSPLIQ